MKTEEEKRQLKVGQFMSFSWIFEATMYPGAESELEDTDFMSGVTHASAESCKEDTESVATIFSAVWSGTTSLLTRRTHKIMQSTNHRLALFKFLL